MGLQNEAALRVPTDALTHHDYRGTLCLMKETTIRQLHEKTGAWVRQAADGGQVVVKDRGRPVATIVPFADEHRGTPSAKRRLVPGFADIPLMGGDCTQSISEDRDRC